MLGARDASGARGGFFRRPGRTADATAARPTYAPFCVLARASACTTFAVVRAPLIVLRADPISTCKGKKASAASRPGNPNRSSPTVSDPRVGPPLRYRPDKFSRRIFCSSYDAAVLPAYESRENDRVFSSLRKRKNFEIFQPAPIEGTSRRATVRGPVVSSAGRRTPVPGGLIKSHRACADRQARGLAYPTLPGFSLC